MERGALAKLWMLPQGDLAKAGKGTWAMEETLSVRAGIPGSSIFVSFWSVKRTGGFRRILLYVLLYIKVRFCVMPTFLLRQAE